MEKCLHSAIFMNLELWNLKLDLFLLKTAYFQANFYFYLLIWNFLNKSQMFCFEGAHNLLWMTAKSGHMNFLISIHIIWLDDVISPKISNCGWNIDFQTLFLMWFGISIKFAIQRYMIWPYLENLKLKIWLEWGRVTSDPPWPPGPRSPLVPGYRSINKHFPIMYTCIEIRWETERTTR